MGLRPNPWSSVDRTDNSKGYGPTNCKWSTPKEQAANRDTNVWLEYRGERKTISQWAEQLNMPFNTFRARMDSLFEGKRPKGQRIQQLDPITSTLLRTFVNGKEASEQTNISQSAIRKCLCGHNATAGGFKWQYLKE